MRQWRELFEAYEEDEQRLLDEIVPLGWLLSPSMGIRTIRLLARELDNRPVEEIDAALVDYFDADRCTEIVCGLYDDPVFEGYRSLLDEALEAHRQGLHQAAIFVWLAVIDGLAEQTLGVRRVYSEVKRKNGGKLRTTFEQSSARREALHDALIEILTRAGIAEPDEHIPKRDMVMHGRIVDFGNERASIQQFKMI